MAERRAGTVATAGKTPAVQVESLPSAHADDETRHPPDDVLVSRYARGDQAAFEQLYHRHKGALFRYLRRQLTPAETDDAFQEVWMRLVDAVPDYDPSGRFTSFLFTLAHNVMIDAHRKHMRQPAETGAQDTIDEAADDADPQTRMEDAQLRSRLHALVAQLPLHQRSVWLLRQETDLSLMQIASLTRTTLEGAKSRLRYARLALRQGMQRYVKS